MRGGRIFLNKTDDLEIEAPQKVLFWFFGCEIIVM
jgi:hypothetical protein